MNKAQILDRIRNRLTLPRVLFQMLLQLELMCQRAIEEMDGLIQEIESYESTDH